jgi:hypothetical protein
MLVVLIVVAFLIAAIARQPCWRGRITGISYQH